MRTTAILMLITGAIVFAISVAKRAFGAYGYAASTEDVIALAVLAGVAMYVFNSDQSTEAKSVEQKADRQE